MSGKFTCFILTRKCAFALSRFKRFRVRTIVLVPLVVLYCRTLNKQSWVDLEGNSSSKYNEFQYGFYITNEKSKETKGGDFCRVIYLPQT
jgi:hypothetical protein